MKLIKKICKIKGKICKIGLSYGTFGAVLSSEGIEIPYNRRFGWKAEYIYLTDDIEMKDQELIKDVLQKSEKERRELCIARSKCEYFNTPKIKQYLIKFTDYYETNKRPME